MNGIMSAEEQRQGGIRILCPVCQKKLKQNLKFDSGARFERLAEVCDQLGFTEEAAIYRKILSDAASAGQFNALVNAAPARGRAASNVSGRGGTDNRRAVSGRDDSRTERLVGGRTTPVRRGNNATTTTATPNVTRQNPPAAAR